MARSDDSAKLKGSVVTWVDEMLGPSDPVLKAYSKHERGLNGDHTGFLLCPSEFDWNDLEYFFKKIKIKIIY